MSHSNDGRNWRERGREFAKRAGREAREAADNPVIGFIAWVLAISLFALLVRVAINNIQPYYVLMQGADRDAPWVRHLPVLGWIVTKWNSLVIAVGALLSWAVVQILQTMWILIAIDRKAKRGALKDARRHSVNPDEFHDRRSRKVAKGMNGIPYFFIRWAAFLALIAYVADFAVGIRLYPPARNLQTFFLALATGMTSRIDWDNALKLVLMLFSFELILVPFVVVAMWIRARKYDAE